MPKKSKTRKAIEIKPILRLLRQQAYSPSKLIKELGLPKNRRLEVANILRSLDAEGKIQRLRGGLYRLPDKIKTLRGRLVQHRPGFAFVVLEQENEADERDSKSFFRELCRQVVDGAFNEWSAIIDRYDLHAVGKTWFELLEFFFNRVDYGEGVLARAHHYYSADDFTFAIEINDAAT